MSTKTTTKATRNGAEKNTPKVEKKEIEKNATQPKTQATEEKQLLKIAQVLKPSGKAIVKRLQHAQILADKYEKMSAKYDDLTQFVAGKDAENSTMKFASESGYTFTLSNPTTISKVLDLVETEFSKHLEDSEKELLNFQIQ
jgi:hypothetical protein